MNTNIVNLTKRVINLEQGRNVNVLAGVTDIDVSAAVYTGYVDLLTIAPADGEGLVDLVIDLDFDKATTGVNDVATGNDTLDCRLVTKIDGTNYCAIESMSQKTLTGTAGELGGHRFKVGMIEPGADLKVQVKLSAERGDCEVPYRVTYRGAAPTITAVAAG